MKKNLLFTLILLLFFVNRDYAQELPVIQGDLKELFAGPVSPSEHDSWLKAMKSWRSEKRKEMNFSGAQYLRPQLAWVNKTFVFAQMMAHDRYFYDPIAGKYTVDRYLNDLKKRYGGIDAVLIWPTYPNIGIDNRNQYDFLASMPGGIEGVKKMIIDFKKRGVRVFFPIMYWDHGTRKIRLSMPAALAKEMKEIGADGLNGDTMWGIPVDFKEAADSIDYPLALQPEVAIKDLKAVQWNQMSWGYFWKYTKVPGVSIYKWLEPRHQVLVTNRWMTDKTDDLQSAFFNGVGFNAWENIWGIWNQTPERYAEAIRRIATIYRQFPRIWSSSQWEPHFLTLQKGIYASKFPGLDKTVYTLINRDSSNLRGRQLQLPYQEAMKYFDLWHGIELSPVKEGDHIFLDFPIESSGFGAVLAIKAYAMDSSLTPFIRKMNQLSKKPLSRYSAAWKPLPQHMVNIEQTKAAHRKPKGMVLIPAAKDFVFKSEGVMIEGDALPTAVGIQHPWEEHPSRSQHHKMDIPSFYMDVYPVTNKDFKKFMDATDYHPADDGHFLKDWEHGTYPKGWGNKPVTWVSMEDARAYADWAGKRLPHEWEWQYAAQGMDTLLYTWGNTIDTTKMPARDSSREMRPPTNVDGYPEGKSPFGVMDMIGNVWQWTDEYDDEHTRNAILKGGGYYRATTSHWYFPEAYELNKYGKYLLMSPGMDRSALIGFRCVKDQ